jgi:hypothetical protein
MKISLKSIAVKMNQLAVRFRSGWLRIVRIILLNLQQAVGEFGYN